MTTNNEAYNVVERTNGTTEADYEPISDTVPPSTGPQPTTGETLYEQVY